MFEDMKIIQHLKMFADMCGSWFMERHYDEKKMFVWPCPRNVHGEKMFADMCVAVGRRQASGPSYPILLVVRPPDGIMLLRGILPEDIRIAGYGNTSNILEILCKNCIAK